MAGADELIEEEDLLSPEPLLELLPELLLELPPVEPELELLFEPSLEPVFEPLFEPLFEPPLEPSPLPEPESELAALVPVTSEEPELLPDVPSAAVLPTAASLVLLVPPALLRKSVTYQPEPLS